MLRVRDVLRAIERKPTGSPALLVLRRPDGGGEPLEIVLRYRAEGPTAVEVPYGANGESFRYLLDFTSVRQHFGGLAGRWSARR